MLKARPRPAFSPPHRRKRHIVALREGDPFWDGGGGRANRNTFYRTFLHQYAREVYRNG